MLGFFQADCYCCCSECWRIVTAVNVGSLEALQYIVEFYSTHTTRWQTLVLLQYVMLNTEAPVRSTCEIPGNLHQK
jgi:hypothetical protein